MVNNGSLHYNNDKDGAETELAGCESQFRNKEYDTFLAVRYVNYKLTVILTTIIYSRFVLVRININRFDKKQKKNQVSTDTENKNTWKECFSVDNVRLPTRYYLGFSAATGDLSDNHDIISVKVYQLESERKVSKYIFFLAQPTVSQYIVIQN
jgi:lectin, mannose-binding 2